MHWRWGWIPPRRDRFTISNALFDALPATEPLTTPVVPNAGAPGGWNLAPGAVVGSVLSVRDLQTGDDNFYVLLTDGVQRISPFVATLLRSANSFGNPLPLAVAPDKLTHVPVVNSLPVGYYPTDAPDIRRHRGEPGHVCGLGERFDGPLGSHHSAVRQGPAHSDRL